MWPLPAILLIWVSVGLGLFLVPSKVEASSLTTNVFVQSLAGGAVCTSSELATSNASGTCIRTGTNQSQSSITGSARANFGSVGADISTSVSIPTTGTNTQILGTYNAEGFAQAISVDEIFDITDGNGNLLDFGILEFLINLDGTLAYSLTAGQSARETEAEVFFNVTKPGEVNNATRYEESITSNGLSVINQSLSFFIPFQNNSADIEINLATKGTCGRISARGGQPSFTCMTSANFFTSATVTGLNVLDNSMNPITNAVVSSDSGFDYQAGFTPHPVPVPGAVFLFGTGLAGLALWRWKKGKQV